MAKKISKAQQVRPASRRAPERPTRTPVRTQDDRTAGDEPRAGDRDEDGRDEDADEDSDPALDQDKEDEEDEEAVDNDRLPLNHPTILDHRDEEAGKLPPEATPREGRTSAPPPLNHPAQGPKARERAAQRSIMVEATAMGYYDHARRRAGDVFAIASDKDFSERWMRRASADARERTTTPNQAIAREHDAILGGRYGGMGHTAGNPSPTAGLDQAREQNPLED